ncbi:MAG: hypothetical protein HYS38_06645 [Acidobacteria bacterium]|nr:hypothetical protein [Acidobacteriota bacterium]
MNTLKKIFLALAVMVALGASSAYAAEQYRITETPTFVINVGRSEVLGAVRITPLTGTVTIASSIDILFRNVACDNTTTNGITLTRAGVYTAANTTLVAPVVNTTAGCTATITIAAGVIATDADADGDFDENSLELIGVRGRIDVSPAFVVGTDIEASVNATPSGSSLFISPTTVRVATSQPGKTVTFAALTQARCLPVVTPPPTITVKEGFPGAFVQHVVSAAGTAVATDARPVVGGLNNTQIRIELVVPTGVTFTWPAIVVGTPAGSGQLELLPTSTATVVIYEFTTGGAGAFTGPSDINTGSFLIQPGVALAVGMTTPASATAAVQLAPLLTTGDAAVTSIPSSAAPFATAVAKPRFNDPLTAATIILTVNPCATYLLFPWVVYTSAAGGGFNTGIAINNTTKDPAIIGTVGQTGNVNLYFFATDGTTQTKAMPYSATVSALGPGQSVANTVSAILGTGTFFSGYVIAVCDFQMGHGFAYISNNLAPPGLQPQGYLAISITNPRLPLTQATDPVPTITESRGN